MGKSLLILFQSFRSHLVSVFLVLFVSLAMSSTSVYANPGDPNSDDPKPKTDPEKIKPYNKLKIAKARFGDEEKRKLLKVIYAIAPSLKERVVGQDLQIDTLVARLTQYVESVGTRTREPGALHMMGLTGIGKTELALAIEALQESGFNVISRDMQSYAKTESFSDGEYYFKSLLQETSDEYQADPRPTILFLDELDKLPEKKEGKDGKETTNPIIGLFNKMLSEGKFTAEGMGTVNLSNVFVITAMNFSPEEIEAFAEEVLGTKKSFYEFTLEDLGKLDTWLAANPNSRYRILSQLFRANTVGRLAPDAVVFKSLHEEDYRKIIALTVSKTAKRVSENAGNDKRISVEIDPKMIDFFFERTVVPASGARETIKTVDRLIEQIMTAAGKAKSNDAEFEETSFGQPRHLKLTPILDAEGKTTGKVHVDVTPQIRVSGKTKNKATFSFEVEYQLAARQFLIPEVITLDPPKMYDVDAPEVKKPPTQKEILDRRFPESEKAAHGLADYLSKKILGQEKTQAVFEKEFTIYLGRNQGASKEPSAIIMGGFPGIGKTEQIQITGEKLGLPVVKINLQRFSSSSFEAVAQFLEELKSQVDQARLVRPDGKFILALEELDKIFEKDPNSGALIDRPVMSVIKDILSEGRLKWNKATDYNNQIRELDLRDSFVLMSMNFAVELFDFKADPELTTIEDMEEAYKSLSTRQADLRNVLSKMFLPETVDRILPNFTILQPLKKEHYEAVIQKAIGLIANERLKGTEIELKLSKEYLRYLYNEAVVPSEGARNTILTVKNRLKADLNHALYHFDKKEKYSKKPVTLNLGFSYETEQVSFEVQIKGDKKGEVAVLKNRGVALNFPPPAIKGPVPKLRIETAVHEFGHAFAAVRLGMRLRSVTVISPESGTGGYMMPIKDPLYSAKGLVADLYVTLASRAMERIFSGKEATDPNSVLSIGQGSTGDIEQATKALWKVLFEAGLDPWGGPIHVKPNENYQTNIAHINGKESVQMAKVLKVLEDHLVTDFLAAHPLEWYREKILEFAKRGTVNEKALYEIIDYPYPGANHVFLGNRSGTASLFGEEIEQNPEELNAAFNFQQGNTKTTAWQNIEAYLLKFSEALQSQWHADEADCDRNLKKDK